nr:MAG TPA: hypothetical protein [Caudoviricetes sp.]
MLKSSNFLVNTYFFNQATGRTRTGDPRITNFKNRYF